MGGLLDVGYVEGVRWGEGVRWRGGGGGVSWGGGSLGPRPGKTAQKPLKSCLKNRSKITTRNERFLSGFLSKILSSKTTQTAQTAQTAQILLENRSNRSNLARFLSGISTREDKSSSFLLSSLISCNRMISRFKSSCNYV